MEFHLIKWQPKWGWDGDEGAEAGGSQENKMMKK